MKKEQKQKDSLWRIIFGILLVIFSLIALSKFNATASLLYLIISIFIFIPGRVFKINKNWVKVIIVILAIFIVGLTNQIGGSNIEEYGLGQEFVLPSDPDYFLMVTHTSKEPVIFVGEQEYIAEEVFLFIYAKLLTSDETINLDGTFTISPFMGLVDSQGNEYEPLPYDLSEMPQAQSLEKGEIFYVYHILNDSTGLKISFTDEKMNDVMIVDLEI